MTREEAAGVIKFEKACVLSFRYSNQSIRARALRGCNQQTGGY